MYLECCRGSCRIVSPQYAAKVHGHGGVCSGYYQVISALWGVLYPVTAL